MTGVEPQPPHPDPVHRECFGYVHTMQGPLTVMMVTAYQLEHLYDLEPTSMGLRTWMEMTPGQHLLAARKGKPTVLVFRSRWS